MALDLDADEAVHFDDVLAAMAESLVETIAGDAKALLFQVKDKPDVKHEFNVPVTARRPPREIFYRQTVTYAQELPKQVGRLRCSCKYVCTGAIATIKCMSCKQYDPTGLGYFCDLCFKQRHPWYRVPHIYIAIERDENIEHSMQIGHQLAETARYQKDGQDVLNKVLGNNKNLRYLEDDSKVDSQLKSVGRKMIDLDERIGNIQLRLRADVNKYDLEHGLGTEYPAITAPSYSNEISSLFISNSSIVDSDDNSSAPVVKLNEDQPNYVSSANLSSIVAIQRMMRGYLTRKLISSIMCERILRVFDELSGRDFFYNKVTTGSTWTLTRLVRTKDLDLIPLVNQLNESGSYGEKVKWCVKRHCCRRSGNMITDPTEAQGIIRNFLRCIKARYSIIEKANTIYSRVIDKDDNGEDLVYYYNHLNQTSSWNKPSIYIYGEPPVLVDSYTKNSPRYNRLKQ